MRAWECGKQTSAVYRVLAIYWILHGFMHIGGYIPLKCSEVW